MIVLKVLPYIFDMVLNTEAVAKRCSVKNVFLQISENSQENPVLESLKEETRAQVFPVHFEKFVTITFLQKTSGDCFCQYASELLKQHL